MAHIVQEELWLPCDMHVVTTNSTTRRDGALVMGRGAARQAIGKFDWLQQAAGKHILQTCKSGGFYGFIWFVPRNWDANANLETDIGLLQVKYHWSSEASVELIGRSLVVLSQFADAEPDRQIRMNYPGIGNGRLQRGDVESTLKLLPDNVTVCYR